MLEVVGGGEDGGGGAPAEVPPLDGVQLEVERVLGATVPVPDAAALPGDGGLCEVSSEFPASQTTPSKIPPFCGPLTRRSYTCCSGLVATAGALVSPDQTFGSIRSLSVSREVASFPLSRTPSPPSTIER